MKIKTRYCYLVYCNKEPIVYGVTLNKKLAIKYANELIDYRRQSAKTNGFDFSFYHYTTESKIENKFDQREKTIFSCCICVNDKGFFSDDGCKIMVIRRQLLTKNNINV